VHHEKRAADAIDLHLHAVCHHFRAAQHFMEARSPRPKRVLTVIIEQVRVVIAGRPQATAIAETSYHYARFLAGSKEGPTLLGVQMLRCVVRGNMIDIRGGQKAWPSLYDPDPANYSPAQQWADGVERNGQDGIVYDSVRNSGGSCVAVIKPRCVSGCRLTGYFAYEWDGTAIVRAHRMREAWRR
jgi:hypothetical protein